MPKRKEPFVNGEIYHVFNKTIEDKRVFTDGRLCEHFVSLMRYYRSKESTLRFSIYRRAISELKESLTKRISDKDTFYVSVLAYCLMPNHFHVLLRQKVNNGISMFIAQIQNAFTHHFNIKYKRKGPLFFPRFRAKRIAGEAQLKHVSRYIHLNPFSSGYVKHLDELETYEWSSFREYLHLVPRSLCEPGSILSLFKRKRLKYRKFVIVEASHQRMLSHCKHMEKWL